MDAMAEGRARNGRKIRSAAARRSDLQPVCLVLTRREQTAVQGDRIAGRLVDSRRGGAELAQAAGQRRSPEPVLVARQPLCGFRISKTAQDDGYCRRLSPNFV